MKGKKENMDQDGSIMEITNNLREDQKKKEEREREKQQRKI